MTWTALLMIFANMFARQVPMLMIAAIGLWMAFARRKQLGRVSIWAFWGFGLLIAYAIAGAAIQLALINIQTGDIVQGPADLSVSLTRLNLWGLAAYPLFICGLAAIARAIFLDRGEADVSGAERAPRGPV